MTDRFHEPRAGAGVAPSAAAGSLSHTTPIILACMLVVGLPRPRSVHLLGSVRRRSRGARSLRFSRWTVAGARPRDPCTQRGSASARCPGHMLAWCSRSHGRNHAEHVTGARRRAASANPGARRVHNPTRRRRTPGASSGRDLIVDVNPTSPSDDRLRLVSPPPPPPAARRRTCHARPRRSSRAPWPRVTLAARSARTLRVVAQQVLAPVSRCRKSLSWLGRRRHAWSALRWNVSANRGA